MTWAGCRPRWMSLKKRLKLEVGALHWKEEVSVQVPWCQGGLWKVAKGARRTPWFPGQPCLHYQHLGWPQPIGHDPGKCGDSFFNKMGLDAKNIAFEEYETVMMKTLLPKCRMLFSWGGVHAIWFFQQDNDLAQKLVISHLNTCNNKHGSSVQLLGKWTLGSPDLNHIDILWHGLDVGQGEWA